MMDLLQVFKRKRPAVEIEPVKQSRIYNDCSEIVVHNFDQVMTYERFEYLKAQPELPATDEALQAAWVNIQSDFIVLSNNIIAMGKIKKNSNLILLEKRMQVFEAIRINIEIGNDVSETCRDYKIKAVNINQEIGLLTNQINKLKPKPITDAEADADAVKSIAGSVKISNIDKSIAEAKKRGYNINRFETTVAEWCQIMRMIENAPQETSQPRTR